MTGLLAYAGERSESRLPDAMRTPVNGPASGRRVTIRSSNGLSLNHPGAQTEMKQESISMTDNRGELVKQVMRQVPYPVTIVTAATSESMRGITIGSFTSLSLDPPLVCFNVEKTSQMHDLLSETDFFSVNIPTDGQELLCNRFSTPDLDDEEQWKDIRFTRNSHGVPLLDDVAIAVDCKLYQRLDGGDHSIFLGEVLSVDSRSDNPAVLYFNGAYHRLQTGK